jgi:hypothetical protein
MGLGDWWQRRRKRPSPYSAGSSTSLPGDDASSTALHTAILLNTPSATSDAARAAPSDHVTPVSSEPPYGPHHTSHHGGSGPGVTNPGYSHSHGHSHSDAGSTGSHDGGASHSTHDGFGGSVSSI